MSRLQSALRDVFADMYHDVFRAESEEQRGGQAPYSEPRSQVSKPMVGWSNSMYFLPHPRVGQGDFSSAAALLWAATSRTSAPELARTFISHLSKKVSGEWYEDNGFIVVKGSPGEWWLDEFRSVTEVSTLLDEGDSGRKGASTPVAVYVVPPAEELPLYAALRVLALAGMHAFFVTNLGTPCSLSFLGGSPTIANTQSEVALLFEEAVREVLKEGVSRVTPSRSAWTGIENAISQTGEHERQFVWLAHHTSAAAPQTAKRAMSHFRSLPGTTVRMPNDGWLISRERAIPEILMEPYLRETLMAITGAEAWSRVLFHFCSSTPSALFDPAVALFDELTSPWYSLQELQRRLVVLVPPSHLQPLEKIRGAESTEVLAADEERHLAVWKSALRLPYRVVSAVRGGEVLEGIGAIEELCRLGHEYLNRPELRHNLYKSEISPRESKILAGINLALSSILPKFGGE